MQTRLEPLSSSSFATVGHYGGGGGTGRFRFCGDGRVTVEVKANVNVNPPNCQQQCHMMIGL
jgi:hypothetical protein